MKSTWLLAATHDATDAGILARAGVDRIVAYHSSVYRAQGLPSVGGLLPWASANGQTLDMLPDVRSGAAGTPVLATVCASDPLRPVSEMLDRLAEAGAAGVVNAPTVGLLTGPVRHAVESAGLGLDAEIGLLRQARERGLEAWAYVFDAEWIRLAVGAGATGLILHLGITGFATPDDVARQLSDAIPAADPHTPLLLHGGPLRVPTDLEQLFATQPVTRGKVDGFFGASAFSHSVDITADATSWRGILEFGRRADPIA
jgi:predicted TIM-barrel enzyme